MILEIFQEENTEVIFSYLPIWEMFLSMHVLSDPMHHVSRKVWVNSKEKHFPELVKEIRELSKLTDYWLLIIDSEKWKEIRQMEITEMISFLGKKNIYQWNEWIKGPSAIQMDIKERDRVIRVIKKYYELVFRKEEILLRSYILRILKKEVERCKKEGIWNWCARIHPRLQIEHEEVVFYKSKEVRFRKEDIAVLFAMVSTFVHPHLWLYSQPQGLEIVKGVQSEEAENIVSEDLAGIFRALGDMTRLQIVKYLIRGINTTQALAQKMKISEAAVSRHLKILGTAGLVTKKRKGLYTVYEFKLEMIDRIPYTFYERMLQ